MGNFVNLSPRCTILSGNDDFSGDRLAGPLVPDEVRRVHGATIEIGDYAMVGAGTIVLPGARVGKGVSVGALSLVKEPLESWGVYAGVPARRIADRSRNVEALADRVRHRD